MGCSAGYKKENEELKNIFEKIDIEKKKLKLNTRKKTKKILFSGERDNFTEEHTEFLKLNDLEPNILDQKKDQLMEMTNYVPEKFNTDNVRKTFSTKHSEIISLTKNDKEKFKKLSLDIAEIITKYEMVNILQIVKIKETGFCMINHKIRENYYLTLSRQEYVEFQDYPLNEIKIEIETKFNDDKELNRFNSITFKNTIKLYDTWIIEFSLYNINKEEITRIIPKKGVMFILYFIKLNKYGNIQNLKEILKFLLDHRDLKVDLFPVFEEEIQEDTAQKLKKFVTEFFLKEFEFYSLPFLKEEEDHQFLKYFEKTNHKDYTSILYDENQVVRFLGNSSYLTKEFIRMINHKTNKQALKKDKLMLNKITNQLKMHFNDLHDFNVNMKIIKKLGGGNNIQETIYQNLFIHINNPPNLIKEKIVSLSKERLFFSYLKVITEEEIFNNLKRYIEFKYKLKTDYTILIKIDKHGFQNKKIEEIEIILFSNKDNIDLINEIIKDFEVGIKKQIPFLPDFSNISAFPSTEMYFNEDFSLYQMNECESDYKFRLKDNIINIIILFGEMTEINKSTNFRKLLSKLKEIIYRNNFIVNVQILNDYYGYYKSGQFNTCPFFSDPQNKILQTKLEKSSNLRVNLKFHKNYFYFYIFNQSQQLKYFGDLSDIDLEKTLFHISKRECFNKFKSVHKCNYESIEKKDIIKNENEFKHLEVQYESFLEQLKLYFSKKDHASYKPIITFRYTKELSTKKENSIILISCKNIKLYINLKSGDKRLLKSSKEIVKFFQKINQNYFALKYSETIQLSSQKDCYYCKTTIKPQFSFYIHPSKNLSICLICENKINNGISKVSPVNLIFVKQTNKQCLKEIVKDHFFSNFRTLGRIERIDQSSCSFCRRYIASNKFAFISLIEIEDPCQKNSPLLICCGCFETLNGFNTNNKYTDMDKLNYVNISTDYHVYKKIWVGDVKLVCEVNLNSNGEFEEIYLRKKYARNIKWGEDPTIEAIPNISQIEKKIIELLETYKCNEYITLTFNKILLMEKFEIRNTFDKPFTIKFYNLVKSKFDFSWNIEPYLSLREEISRIFRKCYNLHGFNFQDGLQLYDNVISLFPLKLTNIHSMKQEIINLDNKDIFIIYIDDDYEIYIESLRALLNIKCNFNYIFLLKNEKGLKKFLDKLKSNCDNKLYHKGNSKNLLLNLTKSIGIDSKGIVRFIGMSNLFQINSFLNIFSKGGKETWKNNKSILAKFEGEYIFDIKSKSSFKIENSKVKFYSNDEIQHLSNSIKITYDYIDDENDLYKVLSYFENPLLINKSQNFKGTLEKLHNFKFKADDENVYNIKVSCIMNKKIYDNIYGIKKSPIFVLFINEETNIFIKTIYREGKFLIENTKSKLICLPEEDTVLDEKLNLWEIKLDKEKKFRKKNLKRCTVNLEEKSVKIFIIFTPFSDENTNLEFFNCIKKLESSVKNMKDWSKNIEILLVFFNSDPENEIDLSNIHILQNEFFNCKIFTNKTPILEQLFIHSDYKINNFYQFIFLNQENRIKYIGDLENLDIKKCLNILIKNNLSKFNPIYKVIPKELENIFPKLKKSYFLFLKSIQTQSISPTDYYISFSYSKVINDKKLNSTNLDWICFHKNVQFSTVFKDFLEKYTKENHAFKKFIDDLKEYQLTSFSRIEYIETINIQDFPKCNNCQNILSQNIPHYLNPKEMFSICIFCEKIYNNENMGIFSNDNLIFLKYMHSEQLKTVIKSYYDCYPSIYLTNQEKNKISKSKCVICRSKFRASSFLYSNLISINPNTNQPFFICHRCFEIVSENEFNQFNTLYEELNKRIKKFFMKIDCLILKKIFYNK